MSNNNVQIRDDVLPEEELRKLQTAMLLDSDKRNTTIPWYISNMYPTKEDAMCEQKEAFYWTHTFHNRQRVESEHFRILYPLLDKINPKALVLIRANCNTITDRIIEHGHHTDFPAEGINCTTSIFYLNTNNGYTLFEEDGSKVQSIENRLCTFPCSVRHSSTTATDVTQRVVINFNYF
jgi:hypothetical protein